MSRRLALASLLVALAACRSEPPAAPAPKTTEATTATLEDVVAPAAASEVVAAPTMPPTPSQDVEPAGPRPRPLRLSENSGDPTGPIGYVVVEPDDADAKTPVLIALHGMGDTAEAFARFVKRLKLRARVFVGRGPLPWGQFGGRQWFQLEAADAIKQIHERAKDLVTLATKVRALYPEAGKPIILGFSQGAAIVLQATLEYPDAWRAAVALSGFIASEGGATRPSAPVPVLVVAGAKDDIIPMERSWAAAGALERFGHTDVRRFEFDGPHQIPSDVIQKTREFLGGLIGP